MLIPFRCPACVRVIGTLLLLALALPAGAAPRIPADDASVLERLPFRATDEQARELRTLRTRAAERPEDPGAASALARRYFRIAMREGDPRYIGYGEAAIARWWQSEATDAHLLATRGLLKQYRHDFAGALSDLGRAGALDPSDETTWSWRAALHVVLADYPAARQDCAQIRTHGSQTGWRACAAWIDGITGQARRAYAAMQEAYAQDRQASPGDRVWTLTRLAELALQLGDAAAAERHFKAAVALPVRNPFLLGAYADFLLGRGRAREVVDLLRDLRASDVLLLRLAIAEKQLGSANAAPRAREMAARFAASAHRADALHLHEEARFVLEVEGDAARALQLAARNYAAQREPRDARVLLQAAVAARDRLAARPALDWLAATGHEDPEMRRLATALEALP